MVEIEKQALQTKKAGKKKAGMVTSLLNMTTRDT